MTRIRVARRERYGDPEAVVEIAETDLPVPGDGQVLVRVAAASVNPLDWHLVTGEPFLARMQAGLRRPKQPRIGTDLAGVVTAVGVGVSEWAPGDEVFGYADGAIAEVVRAKASALVRKPAAVPFEQAAAVAVAGCTALQALRKAGAGAGQQVLVIGASGGVGTFAVQLAHQLGAEVTGVCSTRNVELVRSLGAAHVVDYTLDGNGDALAAHAAERQVRYDVIVDNVGGRRGRDIRALLTPRGAYVVVGGPDGGRVLGPMRHLIGTAIGFAFRRQRALPLMARLNAADLTSLAELLTTGELVPVVDRTWPLDRTGEALALIATHHARAKQVVVM